MADLKQFDVQGARDAGYSGAEIQLHLIHELGYNPAEAQQTVSQPVLLAANSDQTPLPPATPAQLQFHQELDRVKPVFETKINNFLGAIAGQPPNEDVGQRAHTLLEDVLGTHFDQAAREYVKYEQSNPIRRQLTNVMVQHDVNSNADSYLDKVLNARIPYQESVYNTPEAYAGNEYLRSVLSGLRTVLQDKATAGPLIKHLMDFRTLEQPIPFVQSKVNWLPPEQ